MIHLFQGPAEKESEFLTKKLSRFSSFSPLKIRLRRKKCEFSAEEHLAELMPIFEQLRAQGDLPCTYPLHVSSSFGTAFIRGGSRSTPLSPHAPHCHPATHWVSFLNFQRVSHDEKNVTLWLANKIKPHS